MLDPVNHSADELYRAGEIVWETILEEEETQINGVVHVIDLSDIGFNYVPLFNPKETHRMIRNGEVRYHARYLFIVVTIVNSSFRKLFQCATKNSTF